MANQATFHAKISADARQFVQEVESANDAIRGLVQSYDKISKSSGKASGSADKTRKKSTQSEIKAMQDAAIAAGNKVTQAALDNQKKVDQARNGKSSRAKMLQNAEAKYSFDSARQGRQRQNAKIAAEHERKVTREKTAQNAEAREAFNFVRKQVEAEEKRLQIFKEISG